MNSKPLCCPYCTGDISSYPTYKGILGSSMNCPFCDKKIYYMSVGSPSYIEGWYKFSPYTLLAMGFIVFIILAMVFFPSSIACFISWLTGH